VVYWCAVSLIAWITLSLFGLLWYPLHASSAATICLATSIGCFANWTKHRTLHCGITGPVFGIAGAIFLFSEVRPVAIHPGIVWVVVAIVTGFSFLLEWDATRT